MVTFRPAVKSEAKPLVGLYAESGNGKTYGSLLLAKGFTGDMSKVGMVETESGRGEVFADDPIVGGYQVLPLRDNFRPKAYGEAIDVAGKAGLSALIIDSASHEWEGAGGVLGMAAANQAAGKKGPLVWQEPKMEHAREFMLRLLQTPIPLVIVCMRAKYPMEEVVIQGRKEWQRSKDLAPKQSEDILYEMMIHAWIDEAHNLHVTKWTREDLRTVFLDGKPITVETGQRLAAWCSKRADAPAPSPTPTPKPAAEEREEPADWVVSVADIDARGVETIELKRLGRVTTKDTKLADCCRNALELGLQVRPSIKVRVVDGVTYTNLTAVSLVEGP